MESRWEAAAARGLGELELLAYASRLLGGEPDLVRHGGGNSSLKLVDPDPLGRRINVMLIKPSGADMAEIAPRDFVTVRLADLEPLAERRDLEDDAMEELIAWATVAPSEGHPSLETLLHAFLPDRWILHSHADALLALGNRSDGEARLREVLGGRVALVPYRRPGFRLARETAAARRAHPAAIGIVLLRHGLVTFAGDAREAYENHLALVTLCEAAAPLPPLPPAPPLDGPRAVALAPLLRGALASRRILLFDGAPETRAFVADDALLALTQRGPATADHSLRTRRIPCIARGPEEIARFREASRAYADAYDRAGLHPLDPDPAVLLCPGVGMWTAGRDWQEAAAARDVARQTMRILRRAGPAWEPIDAKEQHHAEYWPLQLRKRRERGAGALEGRIAWISGAASGIGRAIAVRFAAEGAHCLLVDRDARGVQATAQAIGVRAEPVTCDVTDEAQVEESFSRACLAFGGVDLVVSNAGIAESAPIGELTREQWERSMAANATSHFLVARAALRVLAAQKSGGAFVFVASKNVLFPGKGFAAYSASKAAETQLARVLALEAAPLGVRVNVLHPDAVFAGSRLWSDEVRRERARAHGVEPRELESFYAGRNLLKLPVRAEDVAAAALFFASDESSRITGASLPIDGGL
ncbi:MAG: SDR family oxidoreductase [Planctomycetaceae bacterium]